MTLRYRPLGGTGIQVSTYCLGTMMLGADGNRDHDECARIIRAALDGGINFIDTADAYGADGGETEQIGSALQGRRDDVVLATKVHFPTGPSPLSAGNSRRWITRAVEDSLRRLGTDWIDLYQLHRPDPATDIEESLSVLTDLVRAGKIRAFGCSTFPPEDIAEAHAVAAARGLMRFRTEQPPYSVLSRGIERSLLPLCQRHRMGVLTWSPLGWGFLTGRIRRGAPAELTEGRAALNAARFDPSLPDNQRKLEAAEKLASLAGELGCSLPQLAVAFPLAHPAVTSVILGPRTLAQLQGLLAGARLELGDEALDRIDEIVPPGTDLLDLAWKPPALTSPALRRRQPEHRAPGNSSPAVSSDLPLLAPLPPSSRRGPQHGPAHRFPLSGKAQLPSFKTVRMRVFPHSRRSATVKAAPAAVTLPRWSGAASVAAKGTSSGPATAAIDSIAVAAASTP